RQFFVGKVEGHGGFFGDQQTTPPSLRIKLWCRKRLCSERQVAVAALYQRRAELIRRSQTAATVSESKLHAAVGRGAKRGKTENFRVMLVSQVVDASED